MIFRHTRNTRWIIKNNYRYIRSDVPAEVSESELAFLKNHNILTIIDLRTESEQLKKPCPLKDIPDFRYLSMPVTGGNAVPESPEQVAVSYLAMLDNQMQKIIRTILNADSNVLYFCNAGKDRTGVVSAMLLKHLGYTDDYIIQDYMQSADNLKEMLCQFVKANPEINLEVITPHENYMKQFLFRMQNQAQTACIF
ncbi:MAG: tyrosine-protein phosphatase [Oscillospiraceae bacterium]|nr:tyrosine-protein phosphatase [Oscillospiraceae bacterium]